MSTKVLLCFSKLRAYHARESLMFPFTAPTGHKSDFDGNSKISSFNIHA